MRNQVMYNILKITNKYYAYGVLLGLMSGVLWGLNNYLYDSTYNKLTINSEYSTYLLLPFIFAAINDTIAAISITAVNIKKGLRKQIINTIKSKSSFIIVIAALLGGPIGQSMYFFGTTYAGVAYALVITCMYPIIGSLLAKIFLKEYINIRMWIGIIISVFGAILFNIFNLENSGEMLAIGLICSLFAAVAWGSEIILATWGMNVIEPDIAINIREIISCIVLIFIVMLNFNFTIIYEVVFNSHIIIGLILMGITAGVSYLFWYKANKQIGCARGMALNSTFLIWGLLFNYIFNNSVFISGIEILAGILVFVGVFLVIINPKEIFKGS